MFTYIPSWQIAKLYNTLEDVRVAMAKDTYFYGGSDTLVLVEVKEAVRPIIPEVTYEQIPINQIKKKDCDCKGASINTPFQGQS